MFVKVGCERMNVRYFTTGDISDKVREMVEGDGELCFGLEMDGIKNGPKKHRIATFQFISPSTGPVIVRIKEGVVPKNIVSLLENDQVVKIAHHFYGDGQFIAYHWRADIKNIICTKVAAKILLVDPKANTSLKPLVEKYLHVEIGKGETFSDWFAEKLSQEQLSYAVQDVLYLSKLWYVLKAELEKVGRLKLVLKLFSAIPAEIEMALDDELKFNPNGIFPYTSNEGFKFKDDEQSEYYTKNGHPSAVKVFAPVSG